MLSAQIKRAGFSAPTPIQAQAWPIAMAGRDMVAIAKTGADLRQPVGQAKVALPRTSLGLCANGLFLNLGCASFAARRCLGGVCHSLASSKQKAIPSVIPLSQRVMHGCSLRSSVVMQAPARRAGSCCPACCTSTRRARTREWGPRCWCWRRRASWRSRSRRRPTSSAAPPASATREDPS